MHVTTYLARETRPSWMSGRPGPSSATEPRTRETLGLARALRTGPCARPCQPRPCSQWPRWCVQHTSTRPQDRLRSHRLRCSSSRLRCSDASALSCMPSSDVLTFAGKPCAWKPSNVILHHMSMSRNDCSCSRTQDAVACADVHGRSQGGAMRMIMRTGMQRRWRAVPWM